jgi:hypothetical protein
MERARRILALVTAAAGVSALAGCGTATIPVGAAPATGPTVAVAKPDSTGFTPLAKWPQACELLDEKDIRAVLPSVSRVVPAASDLKMTNFNLNSTQRTLVARGATCETKLWIPETVKDRDDDPAVTIRTEVRAVGRPAVVKDNFDSFLRTAKDPCPPALDPLQLDDCLQNGYAWSLRKGGIALQVTASAPVLGQDAEYAGQGDADYTAAWTTRIMPELIKAVAVKLP